MSTWPLFAAKCKGVLPVWSVQLTIVASFSTKYLTTSKRLCFAARCTGASPCAFLALTSDAFLLTKYCIMVKLPVYNDTKYAKSVRGLLFLQSTDAP